MNIEHLTQKLEEEKTKLELEMGGIGRRNLMVPNDWESMPSETGAEPDSVDQADVTISSEENAALLADLEARYDTVIEARARISNGTYGKCEVCSSDIEEARLEADPAATTCVKHL
jgi:RNA polymerase-binding transcription factor DksA